MALEVNIDLGYYTNDNMTLAHWEWQMPMAKCH